MKGKGQGKRRYNCNNDYFGILNEENCYWAGFIAADGCVRINKLTFCLSEKDKDHLLKFKNVIQHTGPLRYHAKMVYLEISSKQIVEDLLKHFNITERKSLTLQPPNIDDTQLCYSFIAGYLDGDGWITSFLAKEKYTYNQLGFLGTGQVLEWIKTFLDNQFLIEKPSKPFQRRNIWQYTISGKRADAIINKVRSLSSLPLLKRKWFKYEQS